MEQKGQIFFFGRPDSLKHCIPIRTNNEEEAEQKTEESDESSKTELICKNNELKGSEENKINSDNGGDQDGDNFIEKSSNILNDDDDDDPDASCSTKNHHNNKLIPEELDKEEKSHLVIIEDLAQDVVMTDQTDNLSSALPISLSANQDAEISNNKLENEDTSDISENLEIQSDSNKIIFEKETTDDCEKTVIKIEETIPCESTEKHSKDDNESVNSEQMDIENIPLPPTEPPTSSSNLNEVDEVEKSLESSNQDKVIDEEILPQNCDSEESNEIISLEDKGHLSMEVNETPPIESIISESLIETTIPQNTQIEEETKIEKESNENQDELDVTKTEALIDGQLDDDKTPIEKESFEKFVEKNKEIDETPSTSDHQQESIINQEPIESAVDTNIIKEKLIEEEIKMNENTENMEIDENSLDENLALKISEKDNEETQDNSVQEEVIPIDEKLSDTHEIKPESPIKEQSFTDENLDELTVTNQPSPSINQSVNDDLVENQCIDEQGLENQISRENESDQQTSNEDQVTPQSSIHTEEIKSIEEIVVENVEKKLEVAEQHACNKEEISTSVNIEEVKPIEMISLKKISISDDIVEDKTPEASSLEEIVSFDEEKIIETSSLECNLDEASNKEENLSDISEDDNYNDDDNEKDLNISIEDENANEAQESSEPLDLKTKITIEQEEKEKELDEVLEESPPVDTSSIDLTKEIILENTSNKEDSKSVESSLLSLEKEELTSMQSNDTQDNSQIPETKAENSRENISNLKEIAQENDTKIGENIVQDLSMHSQENFNNLPEMSAQNLHLENDENLKSEVLVSEIIINDPKINEKLLSEEEEEQENDEKNTTQISCEHIEKENTSAIEIHIGTELNITKVEDVSVAEEAIPKEEQKIEDSPLVQDLSKKCEVVDTPKEKIDDIFLSANTSTAKEEEKLANVEIKPAISTRKRKLSEKRAISESDSDDGGSHFVTDSVSYDHESEEEEEEEEEVVQRKKPRIRGKVAVPRKKMPTRHSARMEEAKSVSTQEIETKEEPQQLEKLEEKEEKKDETSTDNQTLQNFKFDYDENEDIAANVAAIKTLICKEPQVENVTKSSDEDDSTEKKTAKRGRKGKRGRGSNLNKTQVQASSDSEDGSKTTKMPDTKRTKTSETNESTAETTKKKRERSKKGLLRDLDASLVIEAVENETPVRQSRRIAQQKIREESERREMEEKMLKKMKEEAEKKKTGPVSDNQDDPDHEQQKESESDSDESYKGGLKKKKKTKIKPADKQWQTSSSHSEHTDTDPDDFEHHHSEDPGSPLFRSDHEFSPESDEGDDDTIPAQPLKRARTAKKQESSDEEDVNPNHACQVCHKTDSPEWILLCDECDCGFHCSCLKPIIFCIPSGSWFCPLCCHKKLIVNLSSQLEKLDTLVSEIEAEEMRKQRQIEARKLTEITEENILRDRRKNKMNKRVKRENYKNDNDGQSSEGEDSDSNNDNNDENSSDDSSDDAPLIYKLRKRNQTAASYRFNDYDDLINSAIREEMDEVKGLGNAGRGKDISTIIEADKEDKKQQKIENVKEPSGGGKKMGSEKEESGGEDEEGESSSSEIGKSKKLLQRKKKNRKLNNLDETSEEDKASDEDFKGSSSSNSDTEEEDYSASSVSESSLDLPRKKNRARRTRSSAKNRRQDRRFIDDASSDDEPLIKKRNKKVDSDEDEFDVAEENESEDSIAEQIDSEDLCDDTDTESSESNWPRKKKRAIASYDKKPRKPAKKYDEDDDKAFRAGISKKKILKKESDQESKESGSDTVTGRRKTRGKKLLYLLEDDYESDDGIKPGIGVIRPETPPEEREMFIKKQEDIKKMLAAKNTEGARQLAVPTIEPLGLNLENPKSPSPPIAEGSSLSTIPKNVIEGAKALDMDYNRIKPIAFSTAPKSSINITAALQQQDMSEEELAKMMEEEDFAQHQLKLAGEAIARNRVLDLEVKDEAFSTSFGKPSKDKPVTSTEPKKRTRKPKVEKILSKPMDIVPAAIPKHPELPPNQHMPHMPIQTHAQIINPGISSAPPPLISNAPSNPFINQPMRFPPVHQMLSHNLQNRPPIMSPFTPDPRHEMTPHLLQQQLRFPHQPPPESFMHKVSLMPPQMQQLHQPPVEEEEKVKKVGRRKKFTPLAKLDHVPSTTVAAASVIHSTLNLSATDRNADEKSKVILPGNKKSTVAVASPPQIFNPATNPTPSVITRLIQQQMPPSQQRLGPYSGFNERDNALPSQGQPSSRAYPSTDEIKHLAAVAASKQPRTSPQAPFTENPFVPRTMHHSLYRPPPSSQSIYGISHARLPYPFHLPPHPNNNNLRPEYAANPYAIPPQFGYYPHGRPQLPPSTGINHGISQHHPDNIHHHPPTHARGEDSPQATSGDPHQQPQQSTSEFGGLVSYFSSQQELD